jgi:hypothetical protein
VADRFLDFWARRGVLHFLAFALGVVGSFVAAVMAFLSGLSADKPLTLLTFAGAGLAVLATLATLSSRLLAALGMAVAASLGFIAVWQNPRIDPSAVFRMWIYAAVPLGVSSALLATDLVCTALLRRRGSQGNPWVGRLELPK